MSFDCQVIFDDNPNGVYYAGENVSGRVQITLLTPMMMKSATILVTGTASCSWSGIEYFRNNIGKRETRAVQYSGEERYLDSLTYLIGDAYADQLAFPEGIHCFTFSAELPSAIPSSFEGDKGQVRYKIKVTLHRWTYDLVYVRPFTVLSLFDLNMDPKYRIPGSAQNSHELSSCCGCSSGTCFLKVGIPYTGYVSGQEIELTLNIRNGSSVDIGDLVFKLQMNSVYYSQEPGLQTKEELTNILELCITPRVPRDTMQNKVCFVKIPALSPSFLNNCSIIDIDYALLVEANPSGCHLPFQLRIPITIGTEPLAFNDGVITSSPKLSTNLLHFGNPLKRNESVLHKPTPSPSMPRSGSLQEAPATPPSPGHPLTMSKNCPMPTTDRYPTEPPLYESDDSLDTAEELAKTWQPYSYPPPCIYVNDAPLRQPPTYDEVMLRTDDAETRRKRFANQSGYR